MCISSEQNEVPIPSQGSFSILLPDIQNEKQTQESSVCDSWRWGSEQRLLPHPPNYSKGFLCTEGVFPLCFGLLFYFTFLSNFDHYHLIWQEHPPRPFLESWQCISVHPEGRRKIICVCVYMDVFPDWSSASGADKEQDVMQGRWAQRAKEVIPQTLRMHVQSHCKRMLNEDDHKRRQVMP